MGKRSAEESREQEMKVVVGKVLSRVDAPSFVIGLVLGCFLVSLTYTLTPKSHGMLSFPISSAGTQSSPSLSVGADPVIPVLQNITSGSEGMMERERISDSCDPKSAQCAGGDGGNMMRIPSTIAVPVQRPVGSDTKQTDVEPQIRRPLCDTSKRWSDVCDIKGDVRVIGKDVSSVILVTPPPVAGAAKLEPWVVMPYARKTDPAAMAHVRQVNVKPSYDYGHEALPRCSVNHTVPAVVFSIAGYTGNYFHDFTDVLVPLFQTSSRFNGEVQLLIANYKAWWIMKYEPFFKKLTRYEIIDYDNDDRVHCFRHVVVGLRSDGDLVIDPSGNPMGQSMVDFAKFMRSAYGLERERATRPAARPDRKRRLLIIARGGTRKFTNLNQIVRAVERAGFEAVVTEASFGGVAEFARVVNSCDAMMGVHGAGLTNFVFLPAGAVLIQVVPFGGLDWIAGNDFGEPSRKTKLQYLEYAISVDESTLTELYSRDDPVFTDVKSIHRRGWKQMGAIYLDKQNVKLDVRRFRPVLKKAMRLLNQNEA